ncbi:MAG: Tol-Pal system beta propeller repeat protein TolB [Rhodospirillaceae bacterium TMED8]|nr:Tol-Pal system beta propeller repeat protein TolB [Magnetovibrio sp.]OUT50218.1 MAG: Tol-Pal system beta propeller repeat protein TolB [Rhodospirillaceae bacterium TMED8]|tara:strand:- start:28 stop:1368 length:1341 start_codon:yes stop_codon:yes gene_type:complete
MKRQRSTRLFVAGLIYVLAALAMSQAKAELKIDITKAVVEPIPIAVTKFVRGKSSQSQYGEDMARVIAANLERSGLFKAVDPRSFIQKPSDIQNLPRFGDWRLINVQALVNGRAHIVADGRLRVEFRLWDVLAEQQMVGLAYFTIPDNWRRVAHIISDAIYKRLTGEDGYFDTRVVYISESGPAIRRVKRLAIMDQDGANHRFLTDGSSLVLTPRFSPTLQEITYLSYHGNVPRVYIFNIDSGRHEILGDFPGMTFAPRFSPDGKSVIMSMAKDGNTEIYSMQLSTRKVNRLTNHTAIDTSPSFAPAQDRVVFNSDRGGSQQLYVMNADGSRVRRISHRKGRYATPVWSPRGDLIAFTKFTGGVFYIGVMYPDGTGERLLSKDFLVEAPTWSPNGRVLMFFRKSRTKADGTGGKSRLWSIDLTGYNEREIVTPTNASDPAWSPLIP